MYENGRIWGNFTSFCQSSIVVFHDTNLVWVYSCDSDSDSDSEYYDDCGNDCD